MAREDVEGACRQAHRVHKKSVVASMCVSVCRCNLGCCCVMTVCVYALMCTIISIFQCEEEVCVCGCGERQHARPYTPHPTKTPPLCLGKGERRYNKSKTSSRWRVHLYSARKGLAMHLVCNVFPFLILTLGAVHQIRGLLLASYTTLCADEQYLSRTSSSSDLRPRPSDKLGTCLVLYRMR